LYAPAEKFAGDVTLNVPDTPVVVVAVELAVMVSTLGSNNNAPAGVTTGTMVTDAPAP